MPRQNRSTCSSGAAAPLSLSAPPSCVSAPPARACGPLRTRSTATGNGARGRSFHSPAPRSPGSF
eukprot:4116686-Pleurochrysis_carterae.AAC.1